MAINGMERNMPATPQRAPPRITVTMLISALICTLEETISDDRILIVDDPISSLDSNVLFIISSFQRFCSAIIR